MSEEATVEQIDDAPTVIESIRTGQYDAEIHQLVQAIRERVEYLKSRETWQKSIGWKPGDRVEVISGRPQYLVGAKATIKKVMQSWCIIRLDQPIGKFGLGDIRSPMSILKKIS